MSATVAIVGTDPILVYEALRTRVDESVGDLDPGLALQEFIAKDAAASSSESLTSRLFEALNTPPFLIPQRVVVVRDAQLLVADEVGALISWMEAPMPGVTLIVAVVGAKSNRLVKAAEEVIETAVGTRDLDRVAFLRETFAQYRVTTDARTTQAIAEVVGDDVARVNALARNLSSIYGTSPLTFAHVEPYLGDAGDVATWKLTDAIEKGNVTAAIAFARRMIDSGGKVGLQLVNALQRQYLNLARLSGSGVTSAAEAATMLGIRETAAGPAMRTSQRLGAERITTAVHWILEADAGLKGAVTYGGKDVVTDADLTELTVIEILVARLARLHAGARTR